LDCGFPDFIDHQRHRYGTNPEAVAHSMHKFLWTGIDPQGRKRSEFVDAENSNAAKAILVGQGWSDLRMIRDEIGSVAAQSTDAPDDMDAEVSADELAEAWEGKTSTFFSNWWEGLAESKVTLLIFGGVLGWGIYTDRMWQIIVGASGLVVFVFLFPAFHIFFSLPLRYYAALNRAKTWGRWSEVLHYTDRLRQVRRITQFGIGEFELTRCRAQAMAGLGSLDKGVQEFSKYGNDPSIPHWMYLCHLAGIHDVGRQFEKSLELRRQAAAENPETANVWIDLAYTLARWINRPAEAREMLARAEKYELPEAGKPYPAFLLGIILWRERNFIESQKNLEEALAGFKALPKNEILDGLILLIKCYLCAVHRAQGNFDTARKLLRETEKFMIAHKEEELLNACRG
jgi:tetratricopeptide (TPR) repeat protein